VGKTALLQHSLVQIFKIQSYIFNPNRLEVSSMK